MKRHIAFPAALLVGLLITTGCASAPSRPSSEIASAPSDAVRSAPAVAPAAPAPSGGAPASAARPAPAAAPQAAQSQSSSNLTDTSQRLIVRNATVVLTVTDVAAKAAEIRQLAQTVGGWVVSSNTREEGGRTIATVSIRVPEPRLDEALGQIKKDVVKVNSEQVSARDVTEEFVDTDAQVRNLRATEQRYLALLSKANTVQEMLQIEQQLSNVRSQIERLQGRLNFLQRSADLSSVSVELRPNVVTQQSWLEDWNLAPVFRSAIVGLINTVQFALAVLIWVVIFVPVWGPIVWLVRRARQRRADRRAARGGPASGPSTPASGPATA
ncbi:MAG: DUF4349 domain-containing protein [Chloroflexi bacterium]|nr:DUF4349 domain-containing protein [Chloroflexota bacterium]